MRLIFFFLAFVNLVIFGWGYFFVERVSTVEEVVDRRSAPVVSTEKVKELNVRPSNQELDAVVDENENENENGKVSEAPLLCHIVGPFSDSKESDDFIERLASMGIRSEKHELELSVGMSHWLYLPPELSRKDALKKLAQLQEQGIDSYVIPKGDLANGISLGMFTKKELADSQLKQIISKGWSPLVKEIDRTQLEVWVMVNHQDGQRLSDISWERVMKGFISKEIRKNFCLGVASNENIH